MYLGRGFMASIQAKLGNSTQLRVQVGATRFRVPDVACADCEHMGIQTILVIDPQGPKYRYQAGRPEPLESRAFDIPGSRSRFDLDEIEKLIDYFCACRVSQFSSFRTQFRNGLTVRAGRAA